MSTWRKLLNSVNIKSQNHYACGFKWRYSAEIDDQDGENEDGDQGGGEDDYKKDDSLLLKLDYKSGGTLRERTLAQEWLLMIEGTLSRCGR